VTTPTLKGPRVGSCMRQNAKMIRTELGRPAVDSIRARMETDWGPAYPVRDGLAHVQLSSGSWWTWAPQGAEILPLPVGGGLPPGTDQREVGSLR
jgi:hypothetical protein